LSSLSDQFKIFHFQELDWLIYFPNGGNRGKYWNYNVLFRNLKRSDQPICQVVLGDLLERPALEGCYPHTVGFHKGSTDEGEGYKPQYMEIRTIHNVDEFWLFLNALNI
jgi:hypothetical protein